MGIPNIIIQYKKNLIKKIYLSHYLYFVDVEYPERKRLRVVLKVPQYPPSMRPFKMQKRLRLMRGPESYHNTLLHKQYGIIVRE